MDSGVTSRDMSPHDLSTHFEMGPDGPTLWSVNLEITASWDLDSCAKCAAITVQALTVKSERPEEDPIGRPWYHQICPPCDWYEREFELRFHHWEDSVDWNEIFWETKRQEFINNLSDSLWFSPKLEEMRKEYHRYVVRLVTLKKQAARAERALMTPIVVPRQVPWSWLENTDYGRFRVDSDSTPE